MVVHGMKNVNSVLKTFEGSGCLNMHNLFLGSLEAGVA